MTRIFQSSPLLYAGQKGYPEVGTTHTSAIIGASLSEPHTSGTALRRCVCIQPCLRPYTVNFKCAFKYFPKIEHPRALTGLLPEYSVSNRSGGDGSSIRTHGTLLLVCHSSYGPPVTINSRLLADRTKYTRRFEIASGKGSA